ncbi:MAG: hypothetical protein B7733_22185 [Myxococcales bacterium FL481]|nr:MAG: hypothetical protein B7733_22185 [Myxococcales bacterium FL481]
MTTLTPMQPTPFGEKYLLIEHIATGGMAEIYRAEYSGVEGFAKELVIKRLRAEFRERPEVVTMFLDEARVAATLTHNNVVHTYDLGEIDGEYYIAMEFLKGEELVAVLRRSVKSGRLIPRELAIGVVMQVLEGLYYVHSRTDSSGRPAGLVHRDINPTNVHVGYDGLCKVVDFGIAATRATALAGTGQFAGKLSYMAPEQLDGQPADARADIFAVGIMLYEMCLGQRLFRGPAVEVRRRILDGDFALPTFVDPAFPPSLEAVIVKALEADPGERYQNCDHMFRDLEAFMREEKLSCTPRNLSAFMAEMFGEGAPAEVNYDDQYDDLVDEALDFDNLETLTPRASEPAAPEWVTKVERKKPRRRSHTMMIGSLRSLVDDVSAGESGAGATPGSSAATSSTGGATSSEASQDVGSSTEESGPQRQSDGEQAPTDADSAEEAGDRSRALRSRGRGKPSSRQRALRTGTGPRRSARTTGSSEATRRGTGASRTSGRMSRSAADRTMTGSFAGSVMREQAGKSHVWLWLLGGVIFALGAYVVYFSFVRALIES